MSRVALSSFQTVVHVRPDGESPETSLQNNPATPVICLFAGSCVARLSEPFAECVRQRAAGLSSEKDRLSNGGLTACWGDPVKKATPAERESAFRLLKAKRQSARSARLDATEKRCRCSISCGREDFDDNMSRAGPERLMSGRYCARDLVNMLGASELLAPAPGSPFSDILEEACNLCIASMDLESRTVPVATSSAFSPFPDAEGETEEEEDGRFFGPRRTLDTRFVQKPIMLAHADALTADLPPSDPGRCFLTVSDDSESAVFDMFSAYWDYVLHSQKRASAAKVALLKPLFQLVDTYKKAYFDYCTAWRSDDELRRLEVAAAAESSFRSPRRKRKRRKKKKKLRVLSPTPSSLAEQNEADLAAPLFSFLESADDGGEDAGAGSPRSSSSSSSRSRGTCSCCIQSCAPAAPRLSSPHRCCQTLNALATSGHTSDSASSSSSSSSSSSLV